MIGIALLLAATVNGGSDHVQVTPGERSPVRVSLTIASAGREGAWYLSTSDGCRFGLRIGQTTKAFRRGAFVREKESSCAAFLSRLAAALDVKAIPKARAVDRVEFDMAISGFDLRRLPDNGGFLASSMGGGWTSTMLSLGEASAPLHLSFNPRTHEAEFVIRDVDFGEDVLRVLGRVL